MIPIKVAGQFLDWPCSWAWSAGVKIKQAPSLEGAKAMPQTGNAPSCTRIASSPLPTVIFQVNPHPHSVTLLCFPLWLTFLTDVRLVVSEMRESPHS